MSAVQSETGEWQLKCFMEWVEKPMEQECPDCNGRGYVGGGFKSISGEETCHSCSGRGRIRKRPTTPPPELPKDLIEHMRRAWWDFHNKEK